MVFVAVHGDGAPGGAAGSGRGLPRRPSLAGRRGAQSSGGNRPRRTLTGRVRRVGENLPIRAVYARSARALVPEISGADLLPGGAGVRAQAVGADGRLVDDFWIHASPRGRR